jgi:hypothetical protein
LLYTDVVVAAMGSPTGAGSVVDSGAQIGPQFPII